MHNYDLDPNYPLDDINDTQAKADKVLKLRERLLEALAERKRKKNGGIWIHVGNGYNQIPEDTYDHLVATFANNTPENVFAVENGKTLNILELVVLLETQDPS